MEGGRQGGSERRGQEGGRGREEGGREREEERNTGSEGGGRKNESKGREDDKVTTSVDTYSKVNLEQLIHER